MLSVLQDIIAGGLSGSFGVLIGFPFDTIKVRMQSQPTEFKTTIQTARDTIRRNGVLSLYKGCLPPIATKIPINGNRLL